jgi:hypothetical protein
MSCVGGHAADTTSTSVCCNERGVSKGSELVLGPNNEARREFLGGELRGKEQDGLLFGARAYKVTCGCGCAGSLAAALERGRWGWLLEQPLKGPGGEPLPPQLQ